MRHVHMAFQVAPAPRFISPTKRKLSQISDFAEIGLNERSPRGPQNPAFVIDLDALAAQQPALLVDGDALAVLGPLTLEAAEGLVSGYDAVAWDLWCERVPPQGVPDCARGGA